MTCAVAVGKVPAPLGYCTESCSIDADCGAGGPESGGPDTGGPDTGGPDTGGPLSPHCRMC